jgi:hypothetical protein
MTPVFTCFAKLDGPEKSHKVPAVRQTTKTLLKASACLTLHGPEKSHKVPAVRQTTKTLLKASACLTLHGVAPVSVRFFLAFKVRR